MTASRVLGERNAFCSSRTTVDSAFPGSHDFASFFSAPLSLPANGPIAATTTSQNNRTRYLLRRPTITRVATLLTPYSPKIVTRTRHRKLGTGLTLGNVCNG